MEEEILKATHGSDKTLLKIGEIEVPVYVLADGMAVLSSHAAQVAVGFPSSASGLSLVKLVGNKRLMHIVSTGLAAAINSPLKFLAPGAGLAARTIQGYSATILIDISRMLMTAKKRG